MARSNVSKRKDELVIAALVCNPTIKAASEACGISERQIRARLYDDEFRARYDAARHELLRHSTAVLQGHLAKAVSTIAEVMESPTASDQTRLNAAESVIRNTLKLTEQTDILERLDAVERKLK